MLRLERWKYKFPALLWNFDRPTKQPNNRRRGGFLIGSNHSKSLTHKYEGNHPWVYPTKSKCVMCIPSIPILLRNRIYRCCYRSVGCWGFSLWSERRRRNCQIFLETSFIAHCFLRDHNPYPEILKHFHTLQSNGDLTRIHRNNCESWSQSHFIVKEKFHI